jgi:transposase
MARLGMRVSHTTIVRRLRQHAWTGLKRAAIRVAGLDEWAWRRGTKFGTIVVDLERRRVVDLLADRRADRMANWFKQHPEIQIINRDRLYADAARQGAPQARQVADRFHLLKNLRETIARQLGGFEAPIRESATDVRDDQDAPEQPGIDRSNRYSETEERERLRRRRRLAVPTTCPV